MLRSEGDKFLDDVTLDRLSAELGVPVTAVKNDGYDFVEKLTGLSADPDASGQV